jgi:hypothetical protein
MCFLTVAALGVAQRTQNGFAKRVIRLHERGADPIRIGQYVQRWRMWITSGVLPKFSIIPMKNGRP